jgi:hypothetical protein
MFLFRFYAPILEFHAVHKPRKSCEFVEKNRFHEEHEGHKKAIQIRASS